MQLPIYQVDAFTERLFSGNPAAVIVYDAELLPETMQAIATENNLAETAFVKHFEDNYAIRWFTPTMEVNLCGHATLASAHVLFNHLGYAEDVVSFSSKSGLLSVRREQNILYLNFPTDTLQTVDAPPVQLINGLKQMPLEVYKGRDDYLVIFEDEKTIASLDPDMNALCQVPSRGIIVSAVGLTSDFVSRFFAPQSGIAEDSVTGSAHTTLIPHWSKRLGKESLSARQISKRGGALMCKYLGERVEIGGSAMTYLEGKITL